MVFKHRYDEKKINGGFTLVELLIVIVVIAVLAAVTVVAYNGIQDRAKYSAIQSDLHNAYMKAYNYVVLSNNGEAAANLAERTAMNISPTRKVYSIEDLDRFVYCIDRDDPGKFGFAAHVNNGEHTWYVTSDGPTVRQDDDLHVAGRELCGEILDAGDPYWHWAVSETGWREWVQ